MRGYSRCAIVTVEGVKVKRCSGCKVQKPLTAFNRGSGPGGYHRHCRECCRAWRKNHGAEQPAVQP